jgi:lysophospholipase L1-like esterase
MEAPRSFLAAHGLAVVLVFLSGITSPLWERGTIAVLAVALCLIYGSIWFGNTSWLAFLTSALRRPWVQRGALFVTSLVLMLGGIEYLAQFLVRTRLVEIDPPMITQLPPGTEDWRRAHITADDLREPDPVLWWHPIARSPYNSHRMKGAEVSEQKPAGVFRVMTYGDSNTDGPDQGGWPGNLQAVLQRNAHTGVVYEVLNAGVAGYSSHQGLLRFRQQVDRFEPNLVLVSFGWNDLAGAIGAPDSSFRPPHPILVSLERFFLHYRSYLILKRYRRPQPAAQEGADLGPRVSIENYIRNMEEFLEAADAHDAKVVFLTRPHRESRVSLGRIENNWRGRVPLYNEALLAFGERTGRVVVDVQAYFESRFPGSFIDECHFTLEGHHQMADFLFERLSNAGYLSAES